MILRMLTVLISALAPAPAGDPIVTGDFRWKSSPPLVAPADRPSDPCDSIKDPTAVFHDGRWHLFCTIRSHKRTHQIEYLNFTDWKDAGKAPRHILKLHDDYFCAPQVFYFTPLKKSCLLYQSESADEKRKSALQPTLVSYERQTGRSRRMVEAHADLGSLVAGLPARHRLLDHLRCHARAAVLHFQQQALAQRYSAGRLSQRLHRAKARHGD